MITFRSFGKRKPKPLQTEPTLDAKLDMMYPLGVGAMYRSARFMGKVEDGKKEPGGEKQVFDKEGMPRRRMIVSDLFVKMPEGKWLSDHDVRELKETEEPIYVMAEILADSAVRFRKMYRKLNEGKK